VTEAVVARACGSLIPVVLEREKIRRPPAPALRKDGIPRVRRTRLNAIGVRNIGENRTTNRPRIDDQWTSRHLRHALTMAVPAENDSTRHCRPEAFTDLTTRCRDQPVLVDLLGQERAVIRWRAVHSQDVVSKFDARWQRVLSLTLLRRKCRACKPVRRVKAGSVAIQHPTVVVPAHRWQGQCGKQFSGFTRPQRPRNVIAKVDRCINAVAPDIRGYRFKRRQIGVDIGNDS